MKPLHSTSILSIFFLFALQPVSVQEGILTLRLTRDFGYAGFSGDIEGLFSLSVKGPEKLRRVDFYLDDQVLAIIQAPPFRYQFTTQDFAPGEHHLSAIGITADGHEMHSNEIVRKFLTMEEAHSKTLGLVIPLLVLVGTLVLAAAGLPLLFGARQPQPGRYGFAGGAVCPKCGFPIPIHLFGLHAIGKRLERCPHCRNWVWVNRAKPQDLATAEARWQGQGNGAVATESDAMRLKRQIDSSRYEK